MKKTISILCVHPRSNYFKVPGLDCWDIKRDAYNFIGKNPVITHAPCAQWSKLKAFANINEYEKGLANFCFDKVLENGGIFEHPAGSSFWKYRGVSNQVVSVNQFWFGFPTEKRTYLYFSKCAPIEMPLNFNAVERKFQNLTNKQRSESTPQFIEWCVSCIRSAEL